jgi:hypothetical protein
MKSSAATNDDEPALPIDIEELDAEETPPMATPLEADRISKPQYCALAYVAKLEPGVARTIKNVILVVVREADGALKFLAHPNLHEVVEVTHLTYVMSLLEELLVCAKRHAEQLFHQLCSLVAGPILPWKVGEKIDDDPEVRDLATQFVPL